MCVSPTLIPNPYYGRFIDGRKSTSIGYNYLHDCVSHYMYVPCGHCSECYSLKQSYLLQRAILLSLDHVVYFGTLTYDNKHLPYVIDPAGDKHFYVDRTDFTLMVKRFRKNLDIPSGTKFMFCTEYGGRRHRPHVHFIMFVPKPADFDKWLPAEQDQYYRVEEKHYYTLFFHGWARNVGTRKFPVYEKLFTYVEKWKAGELRKNFDFHRVVEGSSSSSLYTSKVYYEKTSADVAAYVCKYMLKYDDWFRKKKQYLYARFSKDFPDEYNNIIKLITPKVTLSKHFGDSDAYLPYIRKGIDFSLSLGKSFKGYRFINPYTGKSQALCPYLKRKFVTIDDSHRWYFECASDVGISDGCVVQDIYRSQASKEHSLYRGGRVSYILSHKNLDDFIDDIIFDENL